ncbi:hybrid sensor histidine kinase/response regulator [Olivibacter sp. SDN3]|uniref:hybrid sensor histidine kinase/response regulator n=1 Tax=Olivibacter sp. SDN3 TaxID=2764720 RepID=UPI0016516848|nr:hybrid sensor histidine kinase/response regulator [Olivibacter sp. SDN3]QNL52026.1 hybrid sensor histidine kinase/response regulator [Olivibacter sp. SDN3]
MKKDIQILYIDDEVQNLISFKSSLRFDYQVFIASTINEARHLLEKHPDIRIIFSDQRMPGMMGTDFFEELKSTYPLPIRILLTGYADKEAAINAINRGNVFKFLTKPWNIEEIYGVIKEANTHYETKLLMITQKQELERAYSELDKFTNNVSHDIRNPLGGIISIIKFAERSKNPEEIQDILSLVRTSSEHLDNYVINLQDFYKTKQGQLHYEAIDLNSIFQDLLKVFQAAIITTNIHFIVKNDLQTPFQSDKTLLQIILYNLIANAIKFQKPDTDEKKITIHSYIEDKQVYIALTDTGIGIKEQHKDNIFNLFYRASSQFEGSGLGLYNVSQAVQKLHGQLTVNSVPGEGSTFTIKLPYIAH